MALDKYKITYPNGMVQMKVRIPHGEYLYSKTLPEDDKEKTGVMTQKKYLKQVSNNQEWFTDQSSINAAITSGILVHYGGQSIVTVEKVIE